MEGYELRRSVSIEAAVRKLLMSSLPGLREMPPAEGRKYVGRDFSFDPTTADFYIRLGKVPGPGGRLETTHIVDIEVFARNYLAAESRSLDIEALLLGYPHVVEVDGREVGFDRVHQNVVPDELPWEDDSVSRVGATYAITVRRS